MKKCQLYYLGTTIGEVSMHRSPSANATKVHSMSLLLKQINLVHPCHAFFQASLSFHEIWGKTEKTPPVQTFLAAESTMKCQISY